MKHLFLLFLSVPLFAALSPESRPIVEYPFQGKALENEFRPENGTPFRFGLYDGKGVWDTGREHLKMYLQEHKISYKTFSAADVQKGELKSSGIRALIMPGGESIQYLGELKAEGGEMIRKYVEDGGGYIGICAGAFYATSHREGGNATGPYGIGILKGTAYDGTALHIPPFIEGMMDFPFTPVGALSGLLSRYRIVMFGGPSFRFTAEEAAAKKIQVYARIEKLNEPMMLTLHYGRGKVFLSGPHLEIEENRTNWGKEFTDPDSEWPILDKIVRFVAN